MQILALCLLRLDKKKFMKNAPTNHSQDVVFSTNQLKDQFHNHLAYGDFLRAPQQGLITNFS